MKKIIYNINWSILENVFRLGVSFLVGAYVARYLGTDLYGYYSFILAITFILASFVKFGLETVVVKEIASEKYSEQAIVISSFLIRGMSLLILLLPVVIYAVYIAELNEPYYILVFLVLFLSVFDIITPFFQSKLMNKELSKVKSISLSIATMFKVFFVLKEMSLEYFILAYLIEYAMYTVFGFFLISKYIFNIKVSDFNYTLTCNMFKEGLPLCLSSLSIVLYMKIDQLMIGNMLGNSQLGIYSVAVKLTEALYFLPVVLGNVVMPLLVKASIKSNLEFDRKLKLVLTSSFYISFIIGLVVYFSSELIVSILFGFDYIEAIPILKLYVVNIVFVALGVIAGKWYVITGNGYFSLYRTLTSLGLNVVLNYMFIPKYGILGACYASVLSQFLSSILFNAFHERTRNLFFFQVFSPFGLKLIFEQCKKS